MLRNLGAFMVGYVLLAALFVATEALTVAVAAGGMACLAGGHTPPLLSST